MKDILTPALLIAAIAVATVWLNDQQKKREAWWVQQFGEMRRQELWPIRDAVRKAAGEKSWYDEQVERSTSDAQYRREADATATANLTAQ